MTEYFMTYIQQVKNYPQNMFEIELSFKELQGYLPQTLADWTPLFSLKTLGKTLRALCSENLIGSWYGH